MISLVVKYKKSGAPSATTLDNDKEGSRESYMYSLKLLQVYMLCP